MFANQDAQNWFSMTSLLNSESIIKYKNDLVGATTGGLIVINDENMTILKDNLNNLNLATIGVDYNDLIWIAGTYPNGSIQVLDDNYNLIFDSSYLEIQSIIDFSFSENQVFVAFSNQNEIGILEFKYENGIPYYVDYYVDFPFEISSINDIDIYESYIYLTTNQGMLRSNFLEQNLKFSTSWTEPNYGINDEILYFHRKDNKNFLVTQNYIYLSEDNVLSSIYNIDTMPFDIKAINDKLFFCEKYSCYEMNDTFELVYNSEYEINDFYCDTNDFYLGLKNAGIMSVNIQNTQIKSHYIPNTILQNRYDAITILNNESIAAVSETNGFIYDGEKFTFFIPNEYSERFPINLLDEYMNDGKNSFFVLDYKRGDKFLWSLVENSYGNILFNNSGIRPNYISNDRGGVVEINPESFNLSIYDTSRTQFMINTNYPIGVFDGLYGISNENIFDKYMVINQLKKDNENNIWCITPFSEEYNHIASVQMNDNHLNWKHIFSNDNTSYYPTEVAFDQYNRAWIGFKNLSTNNNSSISDFSKGGLKVVNYLSSIYNSTIDSLSADWYDIENLEVLPNGKNSSILSLDIGKIDNQDLLWVLTPQGVQGYIISGLTLVPIYPLNFYNNISFQEGDKIRVDSQNNAWLITGNYGVRVIKNNATFWPDGSGFDKNNSPLLSDITFDIAFNGVDGMVYILTEGGISIVNTPFSFENIQQDEIYVSPQPFIIPDNQFIEIRNLLNGSEVKILTLNGNVVKQFKLSYNENKLMWNGKDDLNQFLPTGIYYITSYGDDNSLTKKIAIIRN